MFGRKRVQDVTDYDKPFTLMVVKPKYKWSGEFYYVMTYCKQFRYPEEMWAEASKFRGTPGLTTYGPDLSLWEDDRPAPHDTSFDFDDLGVDSSQKRVGKLPRDISSPYDPDMPF